MEATPESTATETAATKTATAVETAAAVKTTATVKATATVRAASSHSSAALSSNGQCQQATDDKQPQKVEHDVFPALQISARRRAWQGLFDYRQNERRG